MVRFSLRTSLCRAVVKYADSKERTFYSLDWNQRKYKKCRETGLSRLFRMISKQSKTVDTATIYDNRTGKEIFKYEHGKWNI